MIVAINSLSTGMRIWRLCSCRKRRVVSTCCIERLTRSQNAAMSRRGERRKEEEQRTGKK